MEISIIIPNYNTSDLIKNCIESICKYTKNIKYEIIVVDNNSGDNSVSVIKKLVKIYPITLIKNKSNIGFAGANNLGTKRSIGKFVLYLNSDTIISDNVIGELVQWMRNNKPVGIASCALLNKDGSMQGTGGYFPTLLTVFSWMTIQDLPHIDNFIRPFHPMRPKSYSKGINFYENEKELDWVTGAFMLIKREVFDQIGGWDENYFMYTEEVDFCFRAKKLGWKVWYKPDWSIIHLGGASSTREFSVLSEYKGVKRFYKNNYPSWKYPFLRIFLKIGAAGRVVLFGLLEGKESAKIYAKAFKLA